MKLIKCFLERDKFLSGLSQMATNAYGWEQKKNDIHGSHSCEWMEGRYR